MKSPIRNIVLVSALVALPSLALAQAGAAGVVSGATQVNPPALPSVPPPPVTPPPPAPPPTPVVQAGGAINGAASAATSVRPPVASPANVNSSAAAQASGAASNNGANLNAASHAAGGGQVQGTSGAGMVSQNHNVSVSINPASTVNEIQTAAFSARQQLASSLEGRVDATQRNLDALRARADAAGDRTRQAFQRSVNEVRVRERALRERLKEATKATGESTWGAVQSALARDYGAYAEAVASAEAAAQGSGSVTTP